MSLQGRKSKIPKRQLSKVVDADGDDLIILVDLKKLKKDVLKFNSHQLYSVVAKDLHAKMVLKLADVARQFGVSAKIKTLIIMED